MIINIRGTSGSGKSTLVRRVMELYQLRTPYRVEGRRQPLGYILSHQRVRIGQLAVIGHYETACGGCDTISELDKIYELVRKSHDMGNNVLYEGLLISAEVNRVIALHNDGLPVMVLALDKVPLETCIESVNARRRARMGDKFTPVNPKNTKSKHRGVQTSIPRLEDAGVEVHRCDRDEAFDIIRGVLFP